MTIRCLPDGTLVRREPDRFSAGELARRAGEIHPDLVPSANQDPVGPWLHDDDGLWCPSCGYALDVHEEAADCPTEAEARTAWGDR
jgi:hypothetical protein